MDTEEIIRASVATVGTVQMIKNFVILKNTKLWTIPTIVLAVLYSIFSIFLPEWVIDIVLVICGASLFYDTIFKAFESFFKNKIGTFGSSDHSNTISGDDEK